MHRKWEMEQILDNVHNIRKDINCWSSNYAPDAVWNEWIRLLCHQKLFITNIFLTKSLGKRKRWTDPVVCSLQQHSSKMRTCASSRLCSRKLWRKIELQLHIGEWNKVWCRGFIIAVQSTWQRCHRLSLFTDCCDSVCIQTPMRLSGTFNDGNSANNSAEDYASALVMHKSQVVPRNSEYNPHSQRYSVDNWERFKWTACRVIDKEASWQSDQTVSDWILIARGYKRTPSIRLFTL